MIFQNRFIASLLGYYVDGWADIVEDMGEKAQNVKSEILQALNNRNMPDITVKETTIQEGILSDDRREYMVTTTSPGATTTIRTAQHGNDLFVSWTSFIRPVPNWRLLGIYVLMSLSVGIVLTIFGSLKQAYEINKIVLSSQPWELFAAAFGKWVLFAAGVCLSILVILVVFGRVIKQDEQAYLKSKFVTTAVIIALLIALFVENIGQTMREEIIQVFDIYKYFQSPFQDFLGDTILSSWVVFWAIIFGAIVLGILLKRSALAFILKEPSLFDAEDIVAMNLTVHKSMLRAVDSVGIDSATLRLKRDFKGGRRGDNM